MGGTTGTDFRLVQRMPLAPCAEHEQDGIHGFAIIDPGPMTPQGVWLTRWEQRLDTCHNASGMRQSRRVCSLSIVTHQRGS